MERSGKDEEERLVPLVESMLGRPCTEEELVRLTVMQERMDRANKLMRELEEIYDDSGCDKCRGDGIRWECHGCHDHFCEDHIEDDGRTCHGCHELHKCRECGSENRWDGEMQTNRICYGCIEFYCAKHLSKSKDGYDQFSSCITLLSK